MILYDIKVYENGKEKETIRNLTYAQKEVLVSMFKRLKIDYFCKEI